MKKIVKTTVELFIEVEEDGDIASTIIDSVSEALTNNLQLNGAIADWQYLNGEFNAEFDGMVFGLDRTTLSLCQKVDIQIEHFEHGIMTFTTEKDFIDWAEKIFNENEGDTLLRPEKVGEYLEYIDEYCDNFTILKTE